jgi:alkylation response protein AidB-like acyl-CoA dehydrogenase
LQEIDFVLNHLLKVGALAAYPDLADYSSEIAASVLQEAARFAEEILEPLNRSGDQTGSKWTPQGVLTPPGFKEAYAKFVEAGWPQLGAPAQHGGQGMPIVLTTAVQEIWGAANLAFKLCPMLTQGAVEALARHSSSEQQKMFLPRMVTGEWSGTMNLTEPQAGSDLAAVRLRAVPEGDHFRLFGTKIFITYGDHDLTDNIIHMVLGRIDGAPRGVRGISMFVVPKFLLNSDGTSGSPNEVRCVSIEHKLGIHASPTCVLAYGDDKGAIGYLTGEANHGLEYMFIMMNAARLSVGLEGFAVSERAFQQAREWARTRVQGRVPQSPGTPAPAAPTPIIAHPDVKRMLLQMKSLTQAMRALGYYTALNLDIGAHDPDPSKRADAQARGELLIPVVKGWCTETGVDIASIGIQVHGGMGYIEETGAAQSLRDVRITPIYEGTTAIQANDLLGRKLARDQGAALQHLIAEMRQGLSGTGAIAASSTIAVDSLEAVNRLDDAAKILLERYLENPAAGLAVAVPFLKLCGVVVGGWLMARADAVARKDAAGLDAQFCAAKQKTAAFYAAQILPEAFALARIVTLGSKAVLDTPEALI